MITHPENHQPKNMGRNFEQLPELGDQKTCLSIRTWLNCKSEPHTEGECSKINILTDSVTPSSLIT
jgi:hypothetical protein